MGVRREVVFDVWIWRSTVWWKEGWWTYGSVQNGVG